jgi:hypothetical protein
VHGTQAPATNGAIGQRISVEKDSRLEIRWWLVNHIEGAGVHQSDEKTGHASMHQKRSREALKTALSAPSLIVLPQRSPTRIKKGTNASAPAP